MSDVIAAARRWLEQDPDATTRDELHALLIAAGAGNGDAVADLHARFDSRLEFGTAGLRGALGAGPNRMNRVLVAQAAAGLAAYLLERAAGTGTEASVVIGYDARTNSDVFARDTAELMAAAGVRAVLLPRMLPTPLVAFAVRHLNLGAGVMVTASHNPPQDNGYKVYLGGGDHGSQIVPPADGEIAAHILRIAAGSVAELPRSQAYEIAEESVVDAYVEQSAAVAIAACDDPTPGADSNRTQSVLEAAADLTVVYTAMHGVGWEVAARVFEAAGFPAPNVVEAQIAPDPRFPTVAFPNPEEPGAMDLAFETASASGADLVIANDPDADRLAIAIPDRTSDSGYRRLSGNEVGALLGWMVAAHAQERGATGTIAVSLVSSPALASVAAHYGHDFAETLTGFKWISRAPGLIFGFEEALGYLVNPDTVRDKDGISAAVLFYALAARLRAAGLGVEDWLDRFTEMFGAFASDQISLRVDDAQVIADIMARLRAAWPSHIGSVRVRQIDDLIDGFADLPPSDVLRIWLEDGSRVVVRPSGTEPKLKVYLDASSTSGDALARRHAAEARVRALADGIRPLLA